MPRPPAAFREAHAITHRYEGVLRARFIRAMKRLQESVSINDLAVMLHSGQGRLVGPLLISKTRITKELEATKTPVRDAVKSGGQLGAQKVNAVIP